MPTPNEHQIGYINKVIYDPNRVKSKVFYNPEDQWNKSLWPGYTPGVKAPPVSLFYLKPVIVCAPCDLINEALTCDCCHEKLKLAG